MVDDLRSVLAKMKKSQVRWCAEEVDDAEEMFEEYPEFLNWAIPILERYVSESLVDRVLKPNIIKQVFEIKLDGIVITPELISGLLRDYFKAIGPDRLELIGVRKVEVHYG